MLLVAETPCGWSFGVFAYDNSVLVRFGYIDLAIFMCLLCYGEAVFTLVEMC